MPMQESLYQNPNTAPPPHPNRTSGDILTILSAPMQQLFWAPKYSQFWCLSQQPEFKHIFCRHYFSYCFDNFIADLRQRLYSQKHIFLISQLKLLLLILIISIYSNYSRYFQSNYKLVTIYIIDNGIRYELLILLSPFMHLCFFGPQRLYLQYQQQQSGLLVCALKRNFQRQFKQSAMAQNSGQNGSIDQKFSCATQKKKTMKSHF
eukprot:TRINITY_DN8006_c1_g2_i2.p1 TRINITY_DN8006_c1_g2~~TRINITY_DN8006_c1_g2_i2.p1  ORF type:complete len:206 (-),score=-19.43 TRINITY_DN8006_c1_g2_i2:669-1286(-)